MKQTTTSLKDVLTFIDSMTSRMLDMLDPETKKAAAKDLKVSWQMFNQHAAEKR